MTASSRQPAEPVLIGCGILETEVRYLAAANGWPLRCRFLDSTLHCNLGKLARDLTDALEAHRGENPCVLYGVCHPLMDRMLNDADATRVEGQNCIEMLLGAAVFRAELIAGAFFLLEDWAVRWDDLLSQTYSRCRPEVMREIFRLDRKYMLALRTPCCGPFDREAAVAAEMMGVPLRWRDVTLDHFESVLKTAIDRCGRRR